MSEQLKCPSCTNVQHEVNGMFGTEMSIRDHGDWYECKICGHSWRKSDKQ